MSTLISIVIECGALFCFLTLHAIFVAAEISLVTLRYSDSERELARLKKVAGIRRLIENSGQTGRLVRFSKTVCTVAAGLMLVPIVRDILTAFGAGPDAPTRWLVFACAFGFAVVVHFTYAELLPRGLAMRDPVAALKATYRVVHVFGIVTWPLLRFFRMLKGQLFDRLGVDVEDEHNPLDIDVQIRAMGGDSSQLSPIMRKIVNRTLQVQDLVVHDILLPRSEVVVCDLEKPFAENLEAMQRAGHTRYPLCHGGLDNCIGIVHIKDIFRFEGPAEGEDPVQFRRNIIHFSEDTPLEEALQRMLRAKYHMALVVDEFGGPLGIITLETILEELVGDIQDEFDAEEAQIRIMGRRETFRVSGLTPIHDLEEQLDIEIGREEVSTFGGLITAELGRIPQQGTVLEIPGLEITVDEVDERRVISATVRKKS